MLRKITIALVGLVVIIAVGGGVWYLTSRQPQVVSKGIKITEVPPQEARRYIKLIYKSKTPETASEALYNIDKLDGKVDEPHIVVRYPKIKWLNKEAGMGVAEKVELIFIDRGDKVLKRVKYTNPGLGKMNVWFSKNRKIAIVLLTKEEGFYWYAYDQKGNLLWKHEGTGTLNVIYPQRISPDGEYIVITDNRPIEYPSPGEIMKFFPGDISKEVGKQVVIVDKRLKLVRSHKIDGYERFGDAIFSPSGNYFAILGFKSNEADNELFLFDRKGKLVSKFKIGKYNIEGISDDSYVFVGYMAPRKFVYSFNGKRIWSENKGMALISDGKKYYYQYSAPDGEKIIDAITRKEILFINRESLGHQFVNIYFPYVYSSEKPILFWLMGKKVSENAYLLVNNNDGLLIKYKDIYTKGTRVASFYVFNDKFWGNTSLSEDNNLLNNPIEESELDEYSCIEVNLSEQAFK